MRVSNKEQAEAMESLVISMLDTIAEFAKFTSEVITALNELTPKVEKRMEEIVEITEQLGIDTDKLRA